MRSNAARDIEEDVIALLDFNNCPDAKKIRDPNSCAAALLPVPVAAATVGRCGPEAIEKVAPSIGIR